MGRRKNGGVRDLRHACRSSLTPFWKGIHACILEAKALIHNGKCDLELRRSFGRTWVGVWTQITKSMFYALSSGDFCRSRNVPRSCQLGNWGSLSAESTRQECACWGRQVRFCANHQTKIWDVGRELIGWGLGKWLVLLRCEDDSGDSISDEWKCRESLKAVTSFVSRITVRVSIAIFIFFNTKVKKHWLT